MLGCIFEAADEIKEEPTERLGENHDLGQLALKHGAF